MTANFFGILRKGEAISCRRIRVSKDVQATLSEEFERQRSDFVTHKRRNRDRDAKTGGDVEKSERIPFFPIYSLHDNSQVFEIRGYELHPELLSAARSPDSVDPLRLDDDTTSNLKAVCASFSNRRSTRVCFQAFERRRLLEKGGWTLLQNPNEFARLDRAGFTVGPCIHAIYDDGTLLFRSFAVTSRFVSLIELFNEASNEKVEEVLNHKALYVADLKSVLERADTVMRKHFAAVSQLGILDAIDPKHAKKVAKELEIDLTLHKERGKVKIEFPHEKKAQKELLRLLTEGYFRGPLTGNLYESISHRPRHNLVSTKR